jgi:hypothetical protein
MPCTAYRSSETTPSRRVPKSSWPNVFRAARALAGGDAVVGQIVGVAALDHVEIPRVRADQAVRADVAAAGAKLERVGLLDQVRARALRAEHVLHHRGEAVELPDAGQAARDSALHRAEQRSL